MPSIPPCLFTIMAFNENTRVKIPAILHLCRLGYQYLSLDDVIWDASSNIAASIFRDALKTINRGISADEILRVLEDVQLSLDNEDLGKGFYEKLTSTVAPKLIDFEEFGNNTFHVVTELPYVNGDDEFRAGITVLNNGLPLAFIEV
jgi:type I restriction enzyme R subunit